MIANILIIIGIILQYLLAWFIDSYLRIQNELGQNRKNYSPSNEDYGFWIMWMWIPLFGWPAIFVSLYFIFLHKNLNFHKKKDYFNPMKRLVKEIIAPRDNV